MSSVVRSKAYIRHRESCVDSVLVHLSYPDVLDTATSNVDMLDTGYQTKAATRFIQYQWRHIRHCYKTGLLTAPIRRHFGSSHLGLSVGLFLIFVGFPRDKRPARLPEDGRANSSTSGAITG